MANPHRTLADRFWSKVQKADGCWLWTGLKTAQGYGILPTQRNHVRRSLLAHRVSFEIALGRAPIGIVCHTCDVRGCVNPAHLYEGTYKQNTADMLTRGRCPASNKTHCVNGHEFTPDNTYTRKGWAPFYGREIEHRRCRTCQRESWATYRRAKIERRRAANG